MQSAERFPNEIYLEIFDYFQSHDELDLKSCKLILANLSLVSRVFASHSKPLLFKTLIFEPQYQVEPPPHHVFCEMLNAGDPSAMVVAPHVHECIFVSEGTVFGPVFTRDELNVYLTAMSKMPHLLTLLAPAMHYPHNNFTDFTSAYTTLKKLSLIGRDISQMQKMLQLSQVTELDLFHREGGDETWSTFVLPSTVRILRTDIWSLGQRVLTARPVLLLEVLELHHAPNLRPDTLLEYLALNRSIIQLRVGLPADIPVFKNRPTPAMLPNLRVLQCDSTLASVLAKVSPQLQKLVLSSELIQESNLVVPPSSSSLTNLTVFQQLLSSLEFQADYPNVTSLSIDMTDPVVSPERTPPRREGQNHPDIMIHSLIQHAISGLSELHFLVDKSNGSWNTYFYFDINGERQRTLLKLLGEHFRRLVKVTFIPQVKWERDLREDWRFVVVPVAPQD
ncbi:hypothetical protein C8J56DRAFT_1031099 [Mycena floridula]|nr:hypothetical protein C8J56DRAFT_1031099 [Mycena floridula]